MDSAIPVLKLSVDQGSNIQKKKKKSSRIGILFMTRRRDKDIVVRTGDTFLEHIGHLTDVIEALAVF